MAAAHQAQSPLVNAMIVILLAAATLCIAGCDKGPQVQPVPEQKPLADVRPDKPVVLAHDVAQMIEISEAKLEGGEFLYVKAKALSDFDVRNKKPFIVTYILYQWVGETHKRLPTPPVSIPGPLKKDQVIEFKLPVSHAEDPSNVTASITSLLPIP